MKARSAEQIAAFKKLSANKKRLLTSHRRNELETDERDARCTLRNLEMRFGKQEFNSEIAQPANGEYIDHDWIEEPIPTYDEISIALELGISRERVRRIIEETLHKLRQFLVFTPAMSKQGLTWRDADFDTKSNRYLQAVQNASERSKTEQRSDLGWLRRKEAARLGALTRQKYKERKIEEEKRVKKNAFNSRIEFKVKRIIKCKKRK